ncbi:CLUMA_CG009325, isoform A [Clunio marinus]|uniref:CLUMA_CG009325, isoform A n=1 Tax=Clunio marinus TaxID=568069 RepID=A0A1J1I6D2_9DIPT|nr:CLUMA_CG009325, isoform A [Clunio marinus]
MEKPTKALQITLQFGKTKTLRFFTDQIGLRRVKILHFTHLQCQVQRRSRYEVMAGDQVMINLDNFTELEIEF